MTDDELQAVVMRQNSSKFAYLRARDAVQNDWKEWAIAYQRSAAQRSRYTRQLLGITDTECRAVVLQKRSAHAYKVADAQRDTTGQIAQDWVIDLQHTAAQTSRYTRQLLGIEP